MRMTGKNHSIKTARIKDVAELDPETLGESTAPDFTFKYIDLSSVKGGRIGDELESMTFAAAPGRARKLVKEGDVLLGMVRPYLKPFAKVQTTLDGHVASTGFAVIRAKSGVTDPEYLYQTIWSDSISKQIHQMVTGSNYPALSVGDVKDLKIPLPPLAEQRKIAEILRTWDESIETAEAELKAKQERKRWLTVSLIFSKGMGAKSKAHKYVPIGNFLREDVDSVDPSQSPDEHFELWSIPAHDKGVADYVKGFQVGSHKKLVNPGDVLISKIVPHIQRSRVVGRSERKCRVIASTEWIIFGGGKIEAEYLREVLISEDFHRKFMETITGVGGSLARANVKAVAKIKIPFPSIQEQRNIADVLLCAGADEGAITQRIESLRAQKRGLMQKLLTGEVRVAA